MIKSIRLQNFESHKDTLIKPAKGTTGIIGDSEHGKSALFRAMYWLAFNRHLGPRPTGSEFRSHWGGTTRVTVSLQDGHKITRSRTNTINRYTIVYPNGKKKQMSGFGLSVPEEVTKLLCLHPLNFQNQHASAYLLPPMAPGEVARRLNEIIDLSSIDKVQGNAKAVLRGCEQAVEITKQNILLHRTRKKELAWTKAAEAALLKLEKIRSELERSRTKEQRLNKILWELEQCKAEQEKQVDLQNAGLAFTKLKGILTEIKKQRQKLKQMKELLAEIEGLHNGVELAGAELSEAEQEFHKKFPGRCPLCGSKRTK